ncbi:hypothetical protein PT250_03670 [Erysipelothrix rhusiopathiae]|uniref:hypothetical protein n=1 Tax=Erysipelothrix rhusiopathiae TaxID=1648 RepID=UPI000210B3C7|nr:hypothetical protein [Erysipelothrix rhusiopathiae]AGN25064.1 hypothetical protein K210_07420 [Erysipelothrix rhusiopathiae SY1027]AMS10210.1 hypothetical protein A2I91_00040 [Erysipelothrix rhusiopathiae]AOO67449.1 hypothetical protein BC346_03675 [Erysipelothrix rhusiopathiae]AWU40749.1 hypothetical protein DM789_00340 [Erysipelothrix rhusiopathiae]MCG4436962.1 hypothetical protein [Erysipelothrix rhusiopathiae]
MEIFNTRSLTQKQRFNVALLVGLVSAVVLGIISGIFRNKVANFSLVIVGVGYLIALAIQKFGRGVQIKFSIAAALFTFLAIVMSDVVTVMGIAGLFDLSSYQIIFKYAAQNEIHSVLWIAYRLLAIYISYNYSRII